MATIKHRGYSVKGEKMAVKIVALKYFFKKSNKSLRKIIVGRLPIPNKTTNAALIKHVMLCFYIQPIKHKLV